MQKKQRKGLYIAVGIIILAIAAMAGVHIYYSGRWYPGSKIEKINVAGMTYEESMNKIEDQISSYQLKIKARDKGTMTISGNDIDLKLDSVQSIKELYETQHKRSVLLSWFGDAKKTVENVFAYSEKKVSQLVEKSVLTTGSNTYALIKPEDATIIYSQDKKYGIIKDEIEGNILDQAELCSVIGHAVDKLAPRMDITDTEMYPDVYKKPGLYKDDAELEQMQKTYNQLLLHWIQWDMGNNVKETLSPEVLKDCIKVDTKKHTVKLQMSKVTKWLEAFCLKYKTQGIARTFKTHSGKKIKVSGGDYGWRIDYDKVLSQVKKILKKTPDENAMEAYKKNATQENQKALMTSLKPVYSHEGYRMDYQKKQNDWDTKNYSEVDLSAQEVYVYRKGKLVFSCTCITGKATPDRITRTGVYDIKEKKLTKTLTGADYSVETRYWTRIMWTGTGYHYSNRGDWGSWSPSYYKTAGSHGCVNLTLSDAASIYKLTKIGDPVFIHY